MAKSKNEFYLRRLHSLLGIIPIGAFLIVHLMINHEATQGAEAFNKAAGFMESLPFLLVTELILIYIPILYHGLYGIHIAFTAKENIGHYSLFRNWMFALQRLTGIIAFVFIFVHLWQTRLQKLFFGKEISYDMMHQTLQNPIWVIVYIICVIAVIFHFSNGIW
ncbi:MAG: succinate dehydrogenase, partial [Staphylococcus sp.]|nr:succinate dehydrogenase [Staphylococcus sp.]